MLFACTKYHALVNSCANILSFRFCWNCPETSKLNADMWITFGVRRGKPCV